jgi:uncharacterized ubiquitin-like protein YukD
VNRIIIENVSQTTNLDVCYKSFKKKAIDLKVVTYWLAQNFISEVFAVIRIKIHTLMILSFTFAFL